MTTIQSYKAEVARAQAFKDKVLAALDAIVKGMEDDPTVKLDDKMTVAEVQLAWMAFRNGLANVEV